MFYVMEIGVLPASDVYLRKISLENMAYYLVPSFLLPSYAAPTALARSWPLCLMLVSGGAVTLTALSLQGEGTIRENSWAGGKIHCHPPLQPLEWERSQEELAGRNPNVLQLVTLG